MRKNARKKRGFSTLSSDSSGKAKSTNSSPLAWAAVKNALVSCIHLSFLFHFTKTKWTKRIDLKCSSSLIGSSPLSNITWTCMCFPYFGHGTSSLVVVFRSNAKNLALQWDCKLQRRNLTPKHAGSAQASPVVWIQKIHVATKGYKSSCKSMLFHISAYRFTEFFENQSDPFKIWHIQQIVAITRWYKSVCKDKNRKAKKTGWLSFSLAVRGMCSIKYEKMPFFVLWKSGFRCAMFNVKQTSTKSTNSSVTIWLSATTIRTFVNTNQYKSIYSIFHIFSDNFHRTQSCSHRTHGHINPVVASAPF